MLLPNLARTPVKPPPPPSPARSVVSAAGRYGNETLSPIVVFNVSADLSTTTAGRAVLGCEVEAAQVQKNWMPLEVDGQMAWVTRVQPLHIVAPSGSGGCLPIFVEDAAAAAGGGAAYASGPPRSYAASLGTRSQLSGNTNLLSLGCAGEGGCAR